MAELSLNDGQSVAYTDTGSGPPLVLLHGWAMSGRVWRYQRDHFAASHRVVVPDLRGHGASSVPVTGPTLDDCAADLDLLLERLGLDRVTLVAWSLGVSVVLRALAAISPRIQRLVFVGGTPCFTAGDGFPHGLPPEEARGMALRLKRNYGRTMEEFFRGMFAPGEVDDAGYRQIVADVVKGGTLPEPGPVLRSLASLAEANLIPALSGVGCPLLLVHGSEDRICLPAASEFMTTRIPGSRLVLLPGTGHAPFLSRPEQFNRLVETFLKDTDDLAH